MKGLYSLSCFHLFSHVLFLSFILCLEGERMAGVEILFSNKYLFLSRLYCLYACPISCFSSSTLSSSFMGARCVDDMFISFFDIAHYPAFPLLWRRWLVAGGLWGVLSVFSVFSCVVLKVDLEPFW